jgi:hypothetical protein
MGTVLMLRETGSIEAEFGRSEILIASAFLDDIGREPACYLKMPENIVPAVESYVRTLRAVNHKAA